MNYSKIYKNDIVNGEGICVSLFVSGCEHQCPGCFNKDAWSFQSGSVYTKAIEQEIFDALVANGIRRNLSILGGEPLHPRNRKEISHLISKVRAAHPDIKIFLWTGYTIEELLAKKDIYIQNILTKINYLIDGPFIEEQKDLTLKWRGSANQRIIECLKTN